MKESGGTSAIASGHFKSRPELAIALASQSRIGGWQLLEIDIATRVFGRAEDIYIVRPGADFALYDEFRAQSRVFLDFPGFGLNPAQPFPEQAEARVMATRSIAVREWHLAGQAGVPPDRDLASYRRKVHGRRVGKYVAAIRRLNYDLPVGAVIVVPGPHLFSEVLIGEISGSRVAVNIPAYPDETLLGRDVRWLARRPKARFSEEFVEKLKTRNPITQLDRSLREEVLRAAFGQYVIGDHFTARLETTEDDFSTLDDLTIQTLVNFVAGAILASEQGLTEEGSLGIVDALDLLRAHRDAVPEFTSNINSPGFQRLLGATIAPLVIIMVMTAAMSGEAVAADNLAAVNSKGTAQDVCAIRVQEKAKAAVKIMRIDDLQRACEQIVATQKQVGLKTSMKVRKKEPKR